MTQLRWTKLTFAQNQMKVKKTKSGDDWLITARDELTIVAGEEELTTTRKAKSPIDGEVVNPGTIRVLLFVFFVGLITDEVSCAL